MTRIFISANPENLKNVLKKFNRTATVEAEYGDILVEGTVASLAHHGPRASSMCPCRYQNYNNLPEGIEAIGVSHFDLDTLGGVAALLNRKPDNDVFWCAAEFVDLNGPHKLSTGHPEIRKLQAFWAWSANHRLFAPRDGSVEDVTDFFMEALSILDKIFAEDAEIMNAGDIWAEEMETLKKQSFRGVYYTSLGRVVLREAEGFTNHLYLDSEGQPVEAVLARKSLTGELTLSFENGGDEERNALQIMRDVFGPKAGGHKGIAGGDRAGGYGLADIESVIKRMNQ